MSPTRKHALIAISVNVLITVRSLSMLLCPTQCNRETMPLQYLAQNMRFLHILLRLAGYAETSWLWGQTLTSLYVCWLPELVQIAIHMLSRRLQVCQAHARDSDCRLTARYCTVCTSSTRGDRPAGPVSPAVSAYSEVLSRLSDVRQGFRGPSRGVLSHACEGFRLVSPVAGDGVVSRKTTAASSYDHLGQTQDCAVLLVGDCLPRKFFRLARIKGSGLFVDTLRERSQTADRR